MRRSEHGFTLVELLIVTVILGVLAAIAIPKFRNTKEQAIVATLKADLRNLATAQESYTYDFSTYYAGALPSGGFVYRVSTGVTVTLSSVTAYAWAATAAHTGTTRTCALFIGNATAPTPATMEGEVKCD